MDDPRGDPSARWDSRELAGLAGLLVAMFAALQVHLRSVIISDMDEGTYVYAGRLIANGLVPYRDFMLTHPPLIALLVAGWTRMFGAALMPLRLAYIVVVLASAVPLYALTRRVADSKRAAFLTIATYASGMLLMANMGRTVRLEPMMNAFVIAAIACRFLRPHGLGWAAAMGALFACAVLVKVVAVIPAGLLLVADALWRRPAREVVRGWAAAAAGGALALAPALYWCLKQPRFVEDVLLGQVNRPKIGLGLRLHYLAQNFERCPPVLLGLVAAATFLVTRRDPRIRSVALVALGSAIVLFAGFKTFFNYYLVQALPWIACCFAIALDEIGARLFPVLWSPVATLAVVALGLGLPIAYGVFYNRTAAAHVAGPKAMLPLLRRDPGYIYSMYPAFALWSERPPVPWYYQADSLVPRINHWIGDREFIDVFSRATTLVLYSGELDEYRETQDYVKTHFRPDYHDDDWSLWQRAAP